MARRQRHYSPQLDRFIAKALYHEAKRQNKPMTKLADEIMAGALKESLGWRDAEKHTAAGVAET